MLSRLKPRLGIRLDAINILTVIAQEAVDDLHFPVLRGQIVTHLSKVFRRDFRLPTCLRFSGRGTACLDFPLCRAVSNCCLKSSNGMNLCIDVSFAREWCARVDARKDDLAPSGLSSSDYSESRKSRDDQGDQLTSQIEERRFH